MRLVAGYTVGTLVHTNEGFRAYIPTVFYKGGRPVFISFNERVSIHFWVLKIMIQLCLRILDRMPLLI